MVRLIELVTIVSLVNFSQAASDEAGKKLLGLSKVSRNTGLNSRSLLQKRCQGTCSECFGAGYMSCPGSDYLCYLPGDPNYGIDSCSGSGSATTAAPSPTTTGSAGNSDFCSGQDATCTSCFGPGYLPCSDGKSCYNPADPDYDTCPDGSGASGGTGSGSSSCASQYGSGSIPCGSDACYNPDEGEVCCSGGYHCFSGQTCSSTIGKCCNSDSTGSGCSGGALTSDTYGSSPTSYSSYDYSSFSTTTDNSYSEPTSATTSISTIQSASDASHIRDVVTISGTMMLAFIVGVMLL